MTKSKLTEYSIYDQRATISCVHEHRRHRLRKKGTGGKNGKVTVALNDRWGKLKGEIIIMRGELVAYFTVDPHDKFEKKREGKNAACRGQSSRRLCW